MKQFFKALNVEGICFQFICATFPELSYDKIKARVFDGIQIKKLVKCKNFSRLMTEVTNEHGMHLRQWLKDF